MTKIFQVPRNHKKMNNKSYLENKNIIIKNQVFHKKKLFKFHKI